MLKTKMLLGLALAMSALAVVAVPASAQWQTKSGQLKGRAVAGVITFEAGGGTFKCESAEGIWKLPQTKQTKSGGYSTLKLHITRWNGCLANGILEIKGSQCEFELKQPQRQEQNIVASQLSPKCTMEIPALGCIITFSSQSNRNLEKIELSNSGQNQIDVFEVKGITSTVNAGCEGFGIKGSTEGKLKTAVTLEGVNVV